MTLYFGGQVGPAGRGAASQVGDVVGIVDMEENFLNHLQEKISNYILGFRFHPSLVEVLNCWLLQLLPTRMDLSVHCPWNQPETHGNQPSSFLCNFADKRHNPFNIPSSSISIFTAECLNQMTRMLEYLVFLQQGMTASCNQHVLPSLQYAADRPVGPERKTPEISVNLVLWYGKNTPRLSLSHLLPCGHRGDTSQWGSFGDFSSKRSTKPFDVTGDSVGWNGKRRRDGLLQLWK